MTVITRRNHGRGHSYKVDGEKFPGVTTIQGKTVHQPWMKGWAARTTAALAVNEWDELSALPLADRYELLRKAPDADAGAAAIRGTRVHRLAEKLVAGAEVEVPDELAGHVESYVDFLDRVQPVPVAVELVVANLTWRYCGTVDLIADLPALVLDGEDIPASRWLLDLKTSRSGVYGEAAIQVCAYSRAEIYTEDDGTTRGLTALGIQRHGVVHVRSDGWDLRPVCTGDEVWDYFLHLRALYDHTDDVDTWVGDAADPPPVTAAG